MLHSKRKLIQGKYCFGAPKFKDRNRVFLIFISPVAKVTQHILVECLLVGAAFAKVLITTILPATAAAAQLKSSLLAAIILGAPCNYATQHIHTPAERAGS